MPSSFFDDDDFMDQLVTLIIRDRQFMRKLGHVLDPSDFKPRTGSKFGSDRWVVASKALEHYEQYREPVGKLITGLVKEHAEQARLSPRRAGELADYSRRLRRAKIHSAQAMQDKVLKFKGQVRKSAAIEEILDAQASGELTDDKWIELCRQAVLIDGSANESVDFFDTLDKRIERRKRRDSNSRYPVTLIEPLDALVKTIARQQLGLIVAPWKRGKSLMLEWLSLAYTLQRLNVLYFTLEDPAQDVEDRFDALVANLPIGALQDKPKLLKKRFALFKRLLKARLKIHDATMGGFTVSKFEQIFLAEKENGFTADAIIIDYDDEIKASRKQADRRHEFADIYRDLRQFCSRQDVFLWTAAQTKRDTEAKKVLTGADLAEDISKVRKVSFALGLGQGEWSTDSLYLYVMAHKNDKEHVGCHIMPNKKRAMIYDRLRTLAMLRRKGEEAA